MMMTEIKMRRSVRNRNNIGCISHTQNHETIPRIKKKILLCPTCFCVMTPSSSNSLISFQSRSMSRRIKRPPPVTILNSDLREKSEDGRVIKRTLRGTGIGPGTKNITMVKGRMN